MAAINAGTGTAEHEDARAIRAESGRESGIQIVADVGGNMRPDALG